MPLRMRQNVIRSADKLLFSRIDTEYAKPNFKSQSKIPNVPSMIPWYVPTCPNQAAIFLQMPAGNLVCSSER